MITAQQRAAGHQLDYRSPQSQHGKPAADK